MSHFCVYVFTTEKSVDDLLAPYNENIIVDKYIEYTKKEAIAKVREDIEMYKHSWWYTEYIKDPEKYKAEHGNNPCHIDYLETFHKKLTWTDEECFQDIWKWYEDDMRDDYGNLYSTYNPKSKWDWYEIGGRWDRSLIKINGEHTNHAYVMEIDWDKTHRPFAFVTPDGMWYEKGEMGWFGCVANEKEDIEWSKIFDTEVIIFGNNIKVTVVDCHI